MKSSFESLQNRFDTIPDKFWELDPDGYKDLCQIILEEEGWSEDEYLGNLLRMLENGEVQMVQNRHHQ